MTNAPYYKCRVYTSSIPIDHKPTTLRMAKYLCEQRITLQVNGLVRLAGADWIETERGARLQAANGDLLASVTEMEAES